MPNLKIPKDVEDQLFEALENDENIGFCTKCWESQPGVELDACKYECESCGALAVYGAAELLYHIC